MKHLFIVTAIFCSALSGYAQQMPQPQAQTANYDKDTYNQLKASSKHALIGGIVFSATGGALIVGGVFTALIGASEEQTDYYGDNISGTENDAVIRTGLIIAGAGVIAELISIPFYITSHKDRDEARAVRFHLNSSSYNMPVSGISSMSKPQLGFGLSIPL